MSLKPPLNWMKNSCQRKMKEAAGKRKTNLSSCCPSGGDDVGFVGRTSCRSREMTGCSWERVTKSGHVGGKADEKIGLEESGDCNRTPEGRVTRYCGTWVGTL